MLYYEAPISWCKEEESTKKVITYLNESGKKMNGNNHIDNLKSAGQRILNNIQTHLERDNKGNQESNFIGKHCVCSSYLYEDPKNNSSFWRRPRRGSVDSYFATKPNSQRQQKVLSQVQERQPKIFAPRGKSDIRGVELMNRKRTKSASVPISTGEDSSHKFFSKIENCQRSHEA